LYIFLERQKSKVDVVRRERPTNTKEREKKYFL